jgi:hypothetical protein
VPRCCEKQKSCEKKKSPSMTCLCFLLHRCREMWPTGRHARAPHTAIHLPSYCYMCVLILLYLCPHPALYVSLSCYICVRSLLNI